MMNPLAWLKPKPRFEDIPPREVPLELSSPRTIVAVRGKWVSVQGRVGIISSIINHDTVVVDYVDPISGVTTESTRVSIGLCALALYRQIPECRRNISREDAELLGYM